MDGPAHPTIDVTLLLQEARHGDRAALDRVVQSIYGELRSVARRQLAREGGGASIHPTTLVHEAYLKLTGSRGVGAADRKHFLAIAARAMRQVLVDEARRRGSAKRGGDWVVTTLSEMNAPASFRSQELLALDDALAELSPREREVVELRFFAGLEEREIADALGVSDRTVRRDWVRARARLYRTLYVAETAQVADAGPREVPLP